MEHAFVQRSQGFGRPAGGDFLEAYLDLLGGEGGDRDLPGCRWHQLGGWQDAALDELVHRADADAEPVSGGIGADRSRWFGFGIERGDVKSVA
jgi:hypothetical protein